MHSGVDYEGHPYAQHTVEEIMDTIVDDLDLLFSFRPSKPVDIEVVSSRQLNQMCQRDHGKSMRANGACLDERNRIVIYVQKGLSRDSLFSTISHEYAHAWQFMEGFCGGNWQRREGFAEWVCCKVCELHDITPNAEYRETTGTSGLYANGLRNFKVLEEMYGVQGVLKAARSNTLNLDVLK